MTTTSPWKDKSSFDLIKATINEPQKIVTLSLGLTLEVNETVVINLLTRIVAC